MAEGTERRRYSDDQERIWKNLGSSQLEQLENSIFDLFHRVDPVIWIVVVKQADIFRKHGAETWPPHFWALTFLQQRAAMFIQKEHGTYENGLFILDATTTFATSAQFQEFLKVRETINRTVPWPLEFGRYLVDVPVLGQSHLIQALQLADIVAHSMWKKGHKDDTLNWFERLEPFLARHWRTGLYDQAGITYIQ